MMLSEPVIAHILRGASYATFVADPPWRFSDKIGKRGAAANYRTLPLEKIKWHQPYRSIVTAPPNAILFLWRVATMQRESLDLAESWGFHPYGELVWDKVTKFGKEHFGMGHLVRASHETCLIATRGYVPVKSRSVRSRFSAPVGRHSEKPDLFFERVEQLVHGPYVELFARKRRPGWTTLGKQVPRAVPQSTQEESNGGENGRAVRSRRNGAHGSRA